MRAAHSNLHSASAAGGLASSGVRNWLLVFPLASAAIIAAQPSAALAALLAGALSVTLSVIAHVSVASAENEGKFALEQQAMGLVAPAQFALLIWVAVSAGRMFASTHAGSTFAAALVLIALFLLDFAVSLAALIAAERREGVCGLSVASLISGKYAGLFGKIS